MPSPRTCVRGSRSVTRPAGSPGAHDEPPDATSTTSPTGPEEAPPATGTSSTCAGSTTASSTPPDGHHGWPVPSPTPPPTALPGRPRAIPTTPSCTGTRRRGAPISIILRSSSPPLSAGPGLLPFQPARSHHQPVASSTSRATSSTARPSVEITTTDSDARCCSSSIAARRLRSMCRSTRSPVSRRARR